MKFPFIVRLHQYIGNKEQLVTTQIYHASYIYAKTLIATPSTPRVMKIQIDHQEIANYAKRLASMLCNQFYRQNAAVTGKQMVEFTDNKQINFFAVKTIFMKWQEETANLRSPYFDYTNPEVAKSLTTLMNLLSQNILIARPAFEPVLATALADSISLNISPASFYEKMLAESQENIHIANQVKPLAKYIKTNKNFFDRLLAYLEREANPTIQRSRAMDLVQMVEQENLPNDDNTEFFNYLSKYIPVSVQNFVSKDEDPLAFDTSTIIPESKVYVQPLPEEKSVETIKIIQTNYEPVITHANSYAHNHIPIQEEIKAEEKLTTEVSVNENLSSQPESYTNINQQFAQTESTADQHSLNTLHDITDKFKGQSLHALIPLNKKFNYVNGLFGGSSAEFEQAIAMIDQCSDYHKAIMLIKEKYFRRFAWDLEKDEVKEFYEMVSKKF
jgi:hypothetical protein